MIITVGRKIPHRSIHALPLRSASVSLHPRTIKACRCRRIRIDTKGKRHRSSASKIQPHPQLGSHLGGGPIPTARNARAWSRGGRVKISGAVVRKTLWSKCCKAHTVVLDIPPVAAIPFCPTIVHHLRFKKPRLIESVTLCLEHAWKFKGRLWP